MGNDDTADEIVRAYLARHAGRLVETEPGLRAGDADAVHDARTATRRLRTALSVYGERSRAAARPRCATSGTRSVRRGTRRSSCTRSARSSAAEPPDLVRGPVAAAHRGGPHRRRAGRARRAGRLARLVVGGPRASCSTSSRVDPTPVRDLRRGARAAWRRLDRTVDALDAAADDERDEALHEVRKAARRARYASEVASGAFGRPARKSAKRARALQEVLGDQHDAVVRRETLHRLSLQAVADGEDTFTYGRLHALARAAAADAEHEARPARRARDLPRAQDAGRGGLRRRADPHDVAPGVLEPQRLAVVRRWRSPRTATRSASAPRSSAVGTAIRTSPSPRAEARGPAPALFQVFIARWWW